MPEKRLERTRKTYEGRDAIVRDLTKLAADYGMTLKDVEPLWNAILEDVIKGKQRDGEQV